MRKYSTGSALSGEGTAQDSIFLRTEYPGKVIISGALQLKIYSE